MVMGTLFESSNVIFALQVSDTMFNLLFICIERFMYVYVGCSDVHHGDPIYIDPEMEQREKTSCMYVHSKNIKRLDFVKRRRW